MQDVQATTATSAHDTDLVDSLSEATLSKKRKYAKETVIKTRITLYDSLELSTCKT